MSEPVSDLKFQENINLAPYNTLNVEARARFFLPVDTVEELVSLFDGHIPETERTFILGGGSNVLFVDDFDGLVARIRIKGRELVWESGDHVYLKIGAGENWHDTVLYCIKKGWGGIENLSLIPGTVGAAPIQNIGAYGVELQEVFVCLEAVDVETGEVKTFEREECRFGYRDSIFKNELKGKYVAATVTLRLSKKHTLNTSYGAIRQKLAEKGIAEPTIKNISDIVIEIRNSKLPDPRDLGNAGSFFKNPVISRQKYDQMKRDYPGIPGYPLNDIEIKIPAAWMIDKAGWKGRVVGNAGTYRQQALVIVNHGGASGSEILELAGRIQSSVRETFGIDLVPEVNIVC